MKAPDQVLLLRGAKNAIGNQAGACSPGGSSHPAQDPEAVAEQPRLQQLHQEDTGQQKRLGAAEKLNIEKKENLWNQDAMFVVLGPQPRPGPAPAGGKMIEECPFVPMRQWRIRGDDNISRCHACAKAGQQDGVGKPDGETRVNR